MNWPGAERWLALWRALGARGDADGWYERLSRAYAEPQRHYHTERHIGECLAEFDAARHLAKRPEAVELALWFHDAVYEPRAADNEERSAAMSKECLESACLSALAAAVGSLILATKSHDAGAGPDVGLIVDVDLSILGREPGRFDEYEADIREEYRWVPPQQFKLKRVEILEGFLARRRIYATDFFRTRYEQQARRNLERSIRRLKS